MKPTYLSYTALAFLWATLAPAQGRPVILLGKTQLLDGPQAYPAFCAKNAKSERSTLRKAVIAKLKTTAAAEQKELLDALGNPKGARSLWIVNAVVVRLDREGIEKARSLDLVKFVYPAGRVASEAPATSGVTEVLEPQKQRKPFSAKGKTVPWNLERLQVPRVWRELKVTGEGVTVAMFDHGLDYTHRDLRNNVWMNPDEVPNNAKDDDGNGLVDDLYGYHFARNTPEVIDRGQRQHGTLTSSVVAGDGTGGQVTGVAPRARIMALVAHGGPYLAARAFQYALEKEADVVNMSFSIPNLRNTRGFWRRMCEHASAAGLVLVSGSGNFQQRVRVPVQIRIPEGIPCVICVGGVDRDGVVTRFSSLGPVAWAKVKLYEDHPMPRGLIKPDVCAFPGPGIGLASTSGEGYLPENNPRRGNSLSAPHVAGTCALMLSANPELTPWRVKAILEATAKDLGKKGKDNRTGAGLVHAFRAVKKARAAR